MSDKFNLNGLWRATSVSGNESLSISVFNGVASLTMFKKASEQRTPSVKINLTRAVCMGLSDLIKKLIDAQPDTRLTFTQQAFNKETRTYETHTTFVFVKDEKRCYSIEITNKMLSTPAKFVLKCPATFALGSEPLTEEQRSLYELRSLHKFIASELSTATFLSRLNMETNQFSRNRAGGSSRGSYRKDEGSKDPYANSSEAAFE